MAKINRLASEALLAVMMLAAAAATATAQHRVDETKPASPTGLVKINNIAGSVEITGWDREEIQVRGTLGEGTERLDFIVEGNETEIRVVLPRRTKNQRIKGSDLKIMLPKGSRINTRTVSADITVNGATGRLDLNSVSGAIDVNDTAGRVRAESISGDISIESSREMVRAKSVSGRIEVGEAVGSFVAGTISGNIDVKGKEIEDGSSNSLSGTIRLYASLVSGGTLEMVTHSGNVELYVPADISATFDVETFSGGIRNDFGQKAQRKSRYGPGRELHFSTGGGDGRISIRVFSGQVVIRKK